MLRRSAGTGSASLFAVIVVIYDHLRFIGCDFKMRAGFFLPDSLASSYWCLDHRLPDVISILLLLSLLLPLS